MDPATGMDHSILAKLSRYLTSFNWKNNSGYERRGVTREVCESVTYVLIEVHAVLFLLPLWNVDDLMFFLKFDALDKIGKRGRRGLHIILFGLYFSFRAFGH